MNPNSDRKLTTLLFNPFVYIAGGQALLLGIVAILVAGLIGSAGNTHFDGVLDVHSGAGAHLWFFLSEGIADWLCLAAVLWIMGRIASRTSFRTIDVLGTQALARWPTVFIALITLPKGFQRFTGYLVDQLLKPGTKAVFSPLDAAVFGAVVLGIILFTCWLVALMYKAYSVSCNLKGGKAIGTFIGGLIIAEILSKLAVYGLLMAGGVSVAHPGGGPAPTPKSSEHASAVPAAPAIVGTWKGALEVGPAKLRVQFRISQGAGGVLTAKMDSLDQNGRDIPVDIVKVKGNTLHLEVKIAQGVYDGTLDQAGTKITGQWQQGLYAAPLVLQKSQGTDEADEFRPPAYAKPALFKEKDVVVGNGEWQLPGTLSMPTGNGPFPAVVLVHGSGPNDRDETVGRNKPFRDLAWGLASQGVAVLRYEKRTRQYAVKMAKSLEGFTVNEETVADALEAVSLLRRTNGIDAGKVFVLGHSLGGMVAPRIGARDPAVAGLIILAGAARPIEDLMLEQTLYQASLAGELSAEAKQRVEAIKRQIAAVKSLSKTNLPPGLLLGAPASYWLDLKDHNPPAAAKALKQSLLVLQGEKDCQVSFKADFAAWRQALANRQDATLKSYPALNHLFIEVAGQSTGAEYQQPGHVAEPVIADIAAWIRSRQVTDVTQPSH